MTWNCVSWSEQQIDCLCPFDSLLLGCFGFIIGTSFSHLFVVTNKTNHEYANICKYFLFKKSGPCFHLTRDKSISPRLNISLLSLYWAICEMSTKKQLKNHSKRNHDRFNLKWLRTVFITSIILVFRNYLAVAPQLQMNETNCF